MDLWYIPNVLMNHNFYVRVYKKIYIFECVKYNLTKKDLLPKCKQKYFLFFLCIFQGFNN